MTVARTQERMWHDVGVPPETFAVRRGVRPSSRVRLPRACDIGQREEALESFPREAFRGLDLHRVVAHELIGHDITG